MPTPKQPQDHQKPAAQVEAEGDGTITVEFRGTTYTLLASADDWPFAATLALEREQFGAFLEQLLDEEQFAVFMATKPTNAQAVELFNAYATALGMPTQGE